MGSVKFNYRQIGAKLASSERGAARINANMQKKFELATEHLIEEFENHPVTEEIKGGIEANNESGTLNGYGNLYSFIGFDSDEPDPTDIVVEILESDLKLVVTRKPDVTTSGDKIKLKYNYSIRVPREKLKEATPLPWEVALSWLYQIEIGISGFGQYLSSKMNDLSSTKRPDKFNKPPSFSEGGLQTKNQLRGGSYKPVPYFNALLRDFVTFFREL